jgi:hypothetical protein
MAFDFNAHVEELKALVMRLENGIKIIAPGAAPELENLNAAFAAHVAKAEAAIASGEAVVTAGAEKAKEAVDTAVPGSTSAS